jgi:Tfp pilus assembly protein PilF
MSAHHSPTAPVTPKLHPAFAAEELDSARLDSWKEIAAYFDRDVSTVRRWEAEGKLPVHRLPIGRRSGVFAYVHELEEWLNQFSACVESEPPTSPSLTVTPEFQATQEPERPVADSPVKRRRGLIGHTLGWNAAIIVLLLAGGSVVAARTLLHHRNAIPTPLASGHTPSAQSQELYLQGRYHWNLRTDSDLNLAVDLFTQAIVKDPNYAASYAGLADSYILLRQYGNMKDSEAFPRAISAARRAIELDGSSPDAHRSLAFCLNYWTWDFAVADQEFLRSLELDPRNAQTHQWYASALWSQDRVADARKEIDLARSIDPNSVVILENRALYWEAVDRPGSVRILRELVRHKPTFPAAYQHLAYMEMIDHDYRGFLRELRAVAIMSKASTSLIDECQYKLDHQGSDAMLRTWATGLAELANSGKITSYGAAQAAATAGEYPQAIAFLDKSYRNHEPGFLTILVDDSFSPIRSRPGFTELVAKWSESTRSEDLAVSRIPPSIR